MYFHIFGSSGLLHLLAGHPKVVAFIGIAGTVALLVSPHGPGRQVGAGRYLDQIDSAVGARAGYTADMEAEAHREALRMIEENQPGEIEDAIRYTLRQCGAGCVDVTTRAVLTDRALLERVLVLHELDRGQQAGATGRGQQAGPAVTSTVAGTR
jgi:hypothetical protein